MLAVGLNSADIWAETWKSVFYAVSNRSEAKRNRAASGGSWRGAALGCASGGDAVWSLCAIQQTWLC